MKKLPTKSQPLSVVFSEDGKFLAAGEEDHTVELWSRDRSNFRFERALQGRQGIAALAFSLDHKFLACGGFGSGNIHIFDPASGKLKRTLWEPSNGINSLFFTPDGQTLVSGGANLKLWNVQIKEDESEPLDVPIVEFKKAPTKWLRKELGDYAATLASLSRNGKIVASADGPAGPTEKRGKVFLWDPHSGAGLFRLGLRHLFLAF